jgi:hypothetical protein
MGSTKGNNVYTQNVTFNAITTPQTLNTPVENRKNTNTFQKLIHYPIF